MDYGIEDTTSGTIVFLIMKFTFSYLSLKRQLNKGLTSQQLNCTFYLVILAIFIQPVVVSAEKVYLCVLEFMINP